VALFAAIAALSFEHERPYSAAMVYAALGVVAGVGIQLTDVSWLDPFDDASTIRHIAEIALIVALFGAGLQIERPARWSQWRVVVLLLTFALPLTVAAVAAWGALGMGLSLGAAIALGAILAPTDPVLAGAIGLGPPGDTGSESDARFNLTAEAALNDSLASPFAILAVFVAVEGGSGWLGEWLLADVAYAVGVAALIGAGLGYGIGWLAVEMRERKLLSPELDGFVVIGAVLAVFGAAELVDSYGLLAVFIAGVAFRRYEFTHEYNRRVHDAAEVARNFSELAIILLLGTLVTTSLFDEPGIAALALVPLLLLLIRPALALLATIGAGIPRAERIVIAWFGAKGVAAVYYVMLLIELGALSGSEAETVFWTTVAVVLGSIFVHGATASALDRRLLAD
jgi:NhaP-type Na+/H+ or K+/H+ antiporter